MNGAEVLVKTAVGLGIEICFANPGTTELPMVVALDRIGGIKGVLCLFEGVCTGAADGYARMAQRPAMTLLHLGPGLANGIANLHNARRARTPIVNIVGEHATWHLPFDPPLSMDIAGLAKSVSGWVRTNNTPDRLPQDLTEAAAAAAKGMVATLIVPHDHQLAACAKEPSHLPAGNPPPLDAQEIETAANLLSKGKRSALILGGRGLLRQGLVWAARIQEASGCDLLAETFPPVLEQGKGIAAVKRIPYSPKGASSLLSQYDVLVLVAAREPVTFFGYPGVPSNLLRTDQERVSIATKGEDAATALAALADLLKGEGKAPPTPQHLPPNVVSGPLTPAAICQTVGALLPEGGIIVDEGLTTSAPYYSMAPSLPPHTTLILTGGAIGYGMPCALGAALASPDRPVINLQADGSAMYTIQALWSQAREGVNVKTLICANRTYRTLIGELRREGIDQPGSYAASLTSLKDPDIDWVSCARGLGIPAVSVADAASLAAALTRFLAQPGPTLIEMRVSI